MDFSQILQMDVALNAVGYIAAGALSVVVYSMFRKRRWSGTAVGRRQTVQHPHPAVAGGDACGGAQVITFQQRPAEPDSAGNRTEAPETMAAGVHHRDRTSILRIAREMIKAGAAPERIQRVLPISEAELALLNCRKD